MKGNNYLHVPYMYYTYIGEGVGVGALGSTTLMVELSLVTVATTVGAAITGDDDDDDDVDEELKPRCCWSSADFFFIVLSMFRKPLLRPGNSHTGSYNIRKY